MQIIKTVFISLMLFTPFLKAYASGLKDSISIGVNTYSDDAGVEVFSPTLSLMKTLSKNFLVGVQLRVDAISSASIRNGSNPTKTDSVTGASSKGESFDEMRYAPTFIMAYEDENNAASGGYYHSVENDYDGRALFLSYTRQFNEQNTAIGIGVSQSSDTWKPVFDRNLPRDDRKESKIDISINQLISPTQSIQFIYTQMYSEGFLSSPYHFLSQSDTARFENYPETREGKAYAIKGVSMLDEENSLNYGYRYYSDDWEISSHTVNVEWLHDLSESFTTGLRARYYTQTASSFAKDIGTYSASDTYYAIDYRMSAFDSYTLGVPFIFQPSLSSPFKLSGSVDLYTTSQNDYIKNWYKQNSITALFTTFTIDYEF